MGSDEDLARPPTEMGPLIIEPWVTVVSERGLSACDAGNTKRALPVGIGPNDLRAHKEEQIAGCEGRAIATVSRPIKGSFVLRRKAPVEHRPTPQTTRFAAFPIRFIAVSLPHRSKRILLTAQLSAPAPPTRRDR